MAEPRLIHIGSAVVDFIYRIDRLPAPGDDLTASSFAALPGGGFNMMVAAKRSGMRTAYAGKIGDGPFGTMIAAALKAEGIEMLQPVSRGIDSGTCVVLVTEGDGERSFVSRPGAEGVITADDFRYMIPAPGDWVFTTGYTLAYPGSRENQTRFIEMLPDHAAFAFDPTGIVGEIPVDVMHRVLARTDWLSLNRSEAAAIVEQADDAGMVQRLFTRHCQRAKGIVLRAGAAGALLALAGKDPVFVPAFRVDAVDTNGAGDAHVGAFIAALSRGLGPLEALRYANAAAAISTTRHGGPTAPDMQEINEFLKRAQEGNSACSGNKGNNGTRREEWS
ncbi:PfkB family carbohydrate kinase [Mesorhizobium sp. RMAD-H1]|uniref:PfkB family carbohydrate kinase n=1 Tax=Mesorhizobium sp. RMAD-H1 TaxID=2587065 RepID=UPI0016208579|nr:PfkB family carbohydrate kinase [Mesorhizobium sp. RMAD-H1]MBB2973165.1 sugar/nucleoside kinase (ribokinase family) [Mesorhizobium sp. RMAD-H1]